MLDTTPTNIYATASRYAACSFHTRCRRFVTPVMASHTNHEFDYAESSLLRYHVISDYNNQPSAKTPPRRHMPTRQLPPRYHLRHAVEGGGIVRGR